MPTEKEFQKNFKSTHLIMETAEIKLVEFEKFLLNHRLNTRKKIFSNSTNFKKILTFFPFVFGFFQFLNNKISIETDKDSFFQKNLPLFANLNPKVNYETLNYIINTNTNLNLNSQNELFILGQKNFVAKLKKPAEITTKKFNGLSCNFYFLPSGNFLSKNIFLTNLDELPSYVQGLNKIKTKKTPELLFNISKNSKLESNTIQKDRNIHFKKKFFLPVKKIKIKLVTSNIPSNNFFTTQKLNASIENDFYKNQTDFLKTFTQFNLEIQNLFLKKKITLHSKDNFIKENFLNFQHKEKVSLENFIKENYKIDDNLLLEILLQDIEQQTISIDLKGSRLMSGYNYPDATSTDLYWFYKKPKFFGKKDRNILNIRPTVTSFVINKYFFSVKDLPKFLIETKKLALQNHSENKIFYSGPTLVLDSKKNLDWKIHSEKNLRAWFHNYLSPLNPFNQIQENFFGVYESPKILNTKSISRFSDFNKKSLLEESFFPTHNRWDLVRLPIESYFNPSISSFHIPADLKINKDFFIRGLDIQLSKNEAGISTEQFLPIIQLQQPNFKSLKQGKNIFSSYSPIFDLGITAKTDYTFSNNYLNSNLFLTKYTSGNYRKKASIFSKTSRLVGSGFDNWEPLTVQSWLIISQLSFAVFIFQILKSLADNYGRELLGYLLDLVASLGFLDDSLKQEIEILMGQKEKGFRVVLKSHKNFTDIIGIQKFLPEIYEIVWFLRNSARDFPLSQTLPRGILLTGPPGTGKTLLVQALAGEAQVPVVVLSGSSLIEPGESGSVKLEMVFQEARQIAPCIVFIDEIDTLAHKRSGVVNNPMGNNEIVETLTSFDSLRSQSQVDTGSNFISEKETDSLVEQNPQQLGLLTQLLIELDGIQGRDGVIVIGATNRPDVLDPALIRPGRFDKILNVGLPKQQKRIEILQFYGKSLGYKNNIPWDYLAERTVGFTAADLATLMNESSIKAILEETTHTIETIEHGIDRLTTSETEKYNLLKLKQIQTSTIQGEFNQSKTQKINSSLDTILSTLPVQSKVTILRLAYYQAGKVLLSYILEKHPKSVVASLWPRRPTIRSVQITTNLQNSLFEFSTLSEINDRLVGCYAGKAAEFLFLENFSARRSSHLSTLGLEDLIFARKLIYSMLEKSFFYSKKNKIQKNVALFNNLNRREFRDIPEKLDLYEEFVETIQNPPMKKAVEIETSSLKSSKTNDIENLNSQIYYSMPWWQQETSNNLEFVEKNFSNWSRLYLSNPEQNERNPEWFPPDEFYHTVSGLKNVKYAVTNLSKQNSLNSRKIKGNQTEPKDFPQKNTEGRTKVLKSNSAKKINFSWNDVPNLTRDYPVQSLILQSFNKALNLLNLNREILDLLVIELLRNEILRQPEIEVLLKDFQKDTLSKKSVVATPNLVLEPFKKETKIKILEKSWGINSRKLLPKWIDFAEF